MLFWDLWVLDWIWVSNRICLWLFDFMCYSYTSSKNYEVTSNVFLLKKKPTKLSWKELKFWFALLGISHCLPYTRFYKDLIKPSIAQPKKWRTQVWIDWSHQGKFERNPLKVPETNVNLKRHQFNTTTFSNIFRIIGWKVLKKLIISDFLITHFTLLNHRC